jgi:CARDB
MCRSSVVLSWRLSVTTAVLLAATLAGCSDQLDESPTAPPVQSAAARPSVPPGFEAALQAQERHTARLMATPGVVGTAVGLNPAGEAVVKVFTAEPDVPGIPATLDQVPVAVEATGRIYARSDPTTRRRPAPVGFSVGHPAITAGTIGGRVKDAAGNVYVLSNNHVLANQNAAQLGDPALQPGPLDGGTDPADRIGTLFDYEPLNLGWNQYGVPPPSNWMDAAIALSSTSLLSNSTPTDDGFGVPSSILFADANSDGFFDDRGLLLGASVQKYGRTTKLTQGQITAVNVTIDVCYDIICFTLGRFFDQVGICCSGFSDGGDSGSLIVSADGNKNPIALLFAGDEALTYGNRIDLVLNRFGVTMDGSAPPPPVTDLAVSAVNAPTAATQGTNVTVGVTVQNVGNQDVTSAIGVTLTDATAQTVIGSQTIPSGLAAGGSSALSFVWATGAASLGSHTLTAAQTFADGNSANDTKSTVVTINQPPSGGTMQVGDLDGNATDQGRTWTAIVTVLIEDPAHVSVSAATVSGAFSAGAKGTGTCTTGSNGTCTITKSRLRSGSVAFTVTSVTHATRTYDSAGNHDPDGDSNGTTLTVLTP